MTFKIKVNGTEHEVDVDGDIPLLWVLRDVLGMTGTKFGCGRALCGACTVHLNGMPLRSCVMPVASVGESTVTTIEAIGETPIGQSLQKAWLDLEVVQCGYCQSGQIMSAAALLAANSQPTDTDIDTAMAGVTGFGLIGHLGEMLVASGANATLDLGSIPLYEGAFTLAREGVASTLLAENLVLGHLLRGEFDVPTRAVLFDPQTCGGLLAGIPADRAAECVAELQANGHGGAAIIGRVIATGLPAGEVTVAASRCLKH